MHIVLPRHCLCKRWCGCEEESRKRSTAGTHCRRWCVTRTVDVEEMNLITAEDARRPTPKPGTSRVKAHLIMPTLAEAGLEMVREKRSNKTIRAALPETAPRRNVRPHVGRCGHAGLEKRTDASGSQSVKRDPRVQPLSFCGSRLRGKLKRQRSAGEAGPSVKPLSCC